MSDVTQKIETPAERVARAREELSKAEAELAEVREAAIKNLDAIKAATVLPAGSLRERLYDAAHAWVGRAHECGEEGCKKPYPCPSDFAQAAFREVLQDVPVKFNPADFIPRAEHERLVEDARRGTRPAPLTEQAAANVPVEGAFLKLGDTIKWLESHGFSKQAMPLKEAKRIFKARLKSSIVPLVKHTQSVKTGWDGLKDGDECWVRCKVVDAEVHQVILPEGSNYNNKWHVSQNNIAAAPVPPAPAPAVAPKGVVEEIKAAADACERAYADLCLVSHSYKPAPGEKEKASAAFTKQSARFLAALSRVTELPEPKGRWKGQVSHVVVHLKDGQTLTSGLATDTFLHDISAALRDSALLAAANPAKEGEE